MGPQSWLNIKPGPKCVVENKEKFIFKADYELNTSCLLGCDKLMQGGFRALGSFFSCSDKGKKFTFLLN